MIYNLEQAIDRIEKSFKGRRTIADMKKSDIDKFEKVQGQVKALHEELLTLSRKSPNDAINKFKLNFINQVLSEANTLLGKNYKPFSDFIEFNEEDIPSNSDVTLIFNQYLSCLEKLRSDNVVMMHGNWFWNISDSDENIRTSTPLKIK